jgi:hypothetical protein
MDLREQMEPEEKARFDRQIEAEQQKLLAIGRTHLELQAFPIGNPDPVPKPQFRKKKTHGVADARGLSGAEIAGLDLKAREALARKKRTAVIPNTEDDGILVPESPPGLAGESQGGTTITLAIRSPEQSRQRPLTRGPLAAGTPILRLFPAELSAPPASTAPSRLAGEAVGPKRKRQHTERYVKAVEDGELDESQHAKIGRR